jgi:hypothetical protein
MEKPWAEIVEEIRTTTADRGSRFGEGAGSGLGREVIGTVAAEPVTDSDTCAREGTEQRLSGKCGGRRRLVDRIVGGHPAGGTVLRPLHHPQSTALVAEL